MLVRLLMTDALIVLSESRPASQKELVKHRFLLEADSHGLPLGVDESPWSEGAGARCQETSPTASADRKTQGAEIGEGARGEVSFVMLS